jgi:hypothetical protein
LLAVKARARQYGYLEIENAATKLERLIEQSKSGAPPTRQKSVDQFRQLIAVSAL